MLLNNNSSKARIISFSGIILAINIIDLLLINFIPINKLIILGIASLFPAIILIEFGTKTSIIYNIAEAILGFFVISNKIIFIGYLLSFCFYGIYKGIVEKKISNIFVEFTLKILYCVLSFSLIFRFTNLFLRLDPIYLYFIIYLVSFIIYDYIFSFFINRYIKDIRKYIKKLY